MGPWILSPAPKDKAPAPVEEAIARIHRLQLAGVELVEQPLPASDADGHRAIAARAQIPVVADEAALSARDVPACAGAGWRRTSRQSPP